MIPSPFRPLPLSADCALDIVALYAECYVEGRVVAARPVIALQVHDRARKDRAAVKSCVIVSRRREPAPLMRFIPRQVPELIVPPAGPATVRQIFAEMAERGIRAALVMLPHCGGALFLLQPDAVTLTRIRRFNRRVRVRLSV